MTLNTIGWRLFLRLYAANFVNAGYRGVLGREPDPEGLAAYTEALARSGDLAGFLVDLARSDEFKQKTFAVLAPDLVRAAYRGLLGRDADPEGLAAYVANLTNRRDLASVLADIVHSEEFTRSRARLQKWPDPANTYNTPCLVFLHIQKTAGTSIQNMLRDSYGHEPIYGENADTLYKRSPGELSKYSVFSGHFNYDSLSYIPRRVLSTFTFVREPKKRLISHYYFLRAHEPGHTSYGDGIRLANELTIETFFEHERIRMRSGFWNHMTWAIMGQRLWRIWQALLAAEANEEAVTELINTTIRPTTRRRLNEFIFVGLQEDFDRSVKILFHILQKKQPETIRADHSLEQLMNTAPHFKKTMEKQPMTSRLDAALDHLVQLDNIVYEEASRLYTERLLEYSGVRIWDTTAEERLGVMHAQSPRSRLPARNRPEVDAMTDNPKNTDMTHEDVIQAFRIVLGRNKEATATAGRRHAPAFTAHDLEEQKLVFLHHPKTGGTTLHHILINAFDKDEVCPERFNGLRHYPAGELARYRYFSGHFDLPSVKLIPGRKKVITMLREPVARLISLYYFQRAHKPETIERNKLELARLANKYSMADFFCAEEVRYHPAVNNAMTRLLVDTIEGERWESKAGSALPDSAQFLQPAVRELEALDAFGILERYDDSVELICESIGLNVPSKIEPRQVLDVIVDEEAGLRRIEKEQVTDKIRRLIEGLVQTDMELYRHACAIFEKRLLNLRRQNSAMQPDSTNVGRNALPSPD